MITEHYAGAFPTWLAPVQIKILPITDRAAEYCKELNGKLDEAGYRVEVDYRNEKIGYKIRSAQLEKIPYMLVIGDKETEAGTVAVRTRDGKDLGAMPLDDFMAMIKKEVAEKK